MSPLYIMELSSQKLEIAAAEVHSAGPEELSTAIVEKAAAATCCLESFMSVGYTSPSSELCHVYCYCFST